MQNTEQAVNTDQEILRLFLQESSKNHAFHLLVKNYERRLYWHIRKLVITHEDADDILQETFIKAWQHLAGFRQDSKLFTWLYRIATNECLAFLKKKKLRLSFRLEDVESELARKIDNPMHYSGSEIEKKLQKAILSLPEKQRAVFLMKYFEELKYEDMSEILGTSVGALKASYHHAVKKIEKLIEKD